MVGMGAYLLDWEHWCFALILELLGWEGMQEHREAIHFILCCVYQNELLASFGASGKQWQDVKMSRK